MAWKVPARLVLRLPSRVLAHLKAGVLTAFLPQPVTIGRWQQPASAMPRKALRPALEAGPAGPRWRPAQPLIETRRKLATRLNLTRTGLPSAVVSTAATKGVLPALPRPRLPPERSPPM